MDNRENSGSPDDVDASGGSMAGGSDRGDTNGETGSSGSRGFGHGTPDGDAGLTSTISGSGLGRPDPNAGVAAHAGDVPEDGGSAGMSSQIGGSVTTPGAGDPGSLDSATSSQGGGTPPQTIKGE